MKKLIPNLILALFCFSSYGQCPYYIESSIGYGVNPLGGDQQYSHYSSLNGALMNNLGGGLTGDLSFGYKYNLKIAFQLNVSYLNSTFDYSGSNEPSYSGSINKWRLIPQIKLKFDSSEHSFYFLGGVVFGLYAEMFTSGGNETGSMMLGFSGYNLDSKYSGNFSIGGMIGIGKDFKLYKSLSFFAEIKFIEDVWTPSHSIVLAGYSSDGYYNPNPPPPPPTSADKLSNMCISTLGIDVGLKFCFGKFIKQ